MNPKSLAIALSLLGISSAANAQNYISVSGGLSLLSDSANRGEFTDDFTTGTGSSIPLGTPLPLGTDVGWTTDFETGFTVGGALGRRYGAIRAEVEFAYQRNDVNTHTGVTAAGLDLQGEDVAVLISGSPPLGASVAATVADGQGSSKTWFGMVNAYYDLEVSYRFRPYVGAGVGVGLVEVDYRPSNVEIINDDQIEFAYQLMAGASYRWSDNVEVIGGYRFRATADSKQDVTLFPAQLEIENEAHVFEVGLRFNF